MKGLAWLFDEFFIPLRNFSESNKKKLPTSFTFAAASLWYIVEVSASNFNLKRFYDELKQIFRKKRGNRGF